MTAKHTISGRAFLISGSCGVSIVLLIFAGNYAATEHYKRVWLDEATEAASKLGSQVSDVKLPHRGPRTEVPQPSPDPVVICGYVDGKRFLYNFRERSIAVDNRTCDARFY